MTRWPVALALLVAACGGESSPAGDERDPLTACMAWCSSYVEQCCEVPVPDLTCTGESPCSELCGWVASLPCEREQAELLNCERKNALCGGVREICPAEAAALDACRYP